MKPEYVWFWPQSHHRVQITKKDGDEKKKSEWGVEDVKVYKPAAKSRVRSGRK